MVRALASFSTRIVPTGRVFIYHSPNGSTTRVMLEQSFQNKLTVVPSLETRHNKDICLKVCELHITLGGLSKQQIIPNLDPRVGGIHFLRVHTDGRQDYAVSIPHINTTRRHTAMIQNFYPKTVPFIKPSITLQSLSVSQFRKRPVWNIWVALMFTIQFHEPNHLLNSGVCSSNLLHKKRLSVWQLFGYEHAGLPIQAIPKPGVNVPITRQYFPIINGRRLIPNRY